ncbi:MAG: hypothetical protein ACOVSW_13410 [Candidatus Kapaibacteriota bacterium]
MLSLHSGREFFTIAVTALPIGFVVQMEAGVKFYVIGLGVNISLNVNPIRSFGTYSVTLCLGWFP